jgi:hypothetical protein
MRPAELFFYLANLISKATCGKAQIRKRHANMLLTVLVPESYAVARKLP